MAESESSTTKKLARIDPFQSLADLREDMARWWGRDLLPWPITKLASQYGSWSPRIDVYEDGEDIVVKAELPGVKRDEVEVTIEDNDLVIRGERKSEKEIKEENYYRLERGYGSFYRRLPLPVSVVEEKAEAKFNDGVLEIHIPKTAQEEPKGKKIAVS